jgi:hypothetical protein
LSIVNTSQTGSNSSGGIDATNSDITIYPALDISGSGDTVSGAITKSTHFTSRRFSVNINKLFSSSVISNHYILAQEKKIFEL